MKCYYKTLNVDGGVKTLLTYDNIKPNIKDPSVVEITEEVYNTLLAEAELNWQHTETDEPVEIVTEEATEADYQAALREMGVEV